MAGVWQVSTRLIFPTVLFNQHMITILRGHSLLMGIQSRYNSLNKCDLDRKDHGPNSEKKWLKEVQKLCLDMIILRRYMKKSSNIWKFSSGRQNPFSFIAKPINLGQMHELKWRQIKLKTRNTALRNLCNNGLGFRQG